MRKPGINGVCQKAWLNTYVNKNFNEFINDKQLKESILLKSPVSANVAEPRKLDDYLKDILEENHKKNELFWDNSLEKLQQKTTNILGPLSKVWWHAIEKD